MTSYDQDRLERTEMTLEDAQERIRYLESQLADMTVLAADYKAAMERFEQELRELQEDSRQRSIEQDLLK